MNIQKVFINEEQRRKYGWSVGLPNFDDEHTYPYISLTSLIDELQSRCNSKANELLIATDDGIKFELSTEWKILYNLLEELKVS